MIKLNSIQQKISEAVNRSGLKQAELAERIGVKQQQISCYLHGTKKPALDTLANLCAVLDIDANEILCVSEY